MMIARTVRQNVVTLTNAFAKASGMSRSEVNRHFYGRGNFLTEFASGKQSISIDKLDRVIAKFRKEWPKGHKFPVLTPVFMD